MPVDSMIVSVCVVVMFVVFAAVLFWADRQTRPERLAEQSSVKRRAF
jgi:cbb3-type cytochrome oxidase subunit 3